MFLCNDSAYKVLFLCNINAKIYKSDFCYILYAI